jgi:hypothetical protein
MWMYWGSDANDAKDEQEKYPEAIAKDEKPQWMSPAPEPVGRLHSPAPQLHGSQASGRKWARKVA